MRGRGLFAAIVALGLPMHSQAGTLAEIEARGSLRACFALTNPDLIRVAPAECTDNCTFSGLLWDQAQSFAASLEVTLDPRVVSWSDQFANAEGRVERAESYVPYLLTNGTCDIFMSNLARLPWRLTKMEIVPLYESRMIAIVRDTRLGEFTSRDSFAGKSAAVALNSSFHTWVLDRNQDEFASDPIRVLPLEGRSAHEMVADGDADFSLTDADIAVLTQRRLGGGAVPAFAVGPMQHLGWGVAREASALQSRIADFFETQTADPRAPLNQAWQTHLGVTITEFEALIGTLPDADGPDEDVR